MENFKGNRNLINSSEALIFDLYKDKSSFDCVNPLKEFIQYIKFTGVKGPIKFSYMSGAENLLPNKSIKENLILDSLSLSLNRNKEVCFQKKIQALQCKNLTNFFLELESIDRTVESYNQEEISIISVIKSLLSDAEYLLVALTETSLSSSSFTMIKECLRRELYIKQRHILILSPNPENWLDLATGIIHKDDSLKYIKSRNTINQTKSKVLPISSYNKAS